MQRRNFLQLTSLLGLTSLWPKRKILAADAAATDKHQQDRKYWVALLQKIASPVLEPMSKGELRKTMIVEVSPAWDGRPNVVAYMEAFGRLIAGLAPFVNLPDEESDEGRIRKKIKQQIQRSLAHAVDPASPDYLYWGTPQSRQPLVDAAFIAQALLAAPDALWMPLDTITKQRVIHEFKTIRQIKPVNNNWVLFAAMIETFLLHIDEPIDASRIDTAVETIEKWYIGDGWYKDGEKFHFDHYNGFVIHPMLVEVLRKNVAKGRMDKSRYEVAYKRMQRYASYQERFISPEGTFPVFGRSSTYRAGLFQPLTKLALEHALPNGITPAQVRCGLTAVLKKLFVPATFTNAGYLTLGLVGDQQTGIADSYSNTGSMYLTAYVFLPLGLPATDPFWTDPYADWTQRKAWSGKPFAKDYAVDY